MRFQRLPRPTLCLIGIMGLAFGLRFALARAHLFWFPDSVDYDQLARALLHGEYISAGHVATRMPGYPFFVAALYKILGSGSLLAVMFFQALMGVATVGLTFMIARRMNDWAAVIAAALVALDPLTIGFTATLLTETPYTLLLMDALLLALRLAEEPQPKLHRWLKLGFLWGLGVYFRASALWGIVPLGLMILWSRQREKSQLPKSRSLLAKNTAALAAAIAVVFALLLPWFIRNYQIFHTGFFRLTTLEGISLYEAVYPDATGGPRQHLITPPPEFSQLNEAQQNDQLAQQGWAYVRTDPARILRLALVKITRTWAPWLNADEFRSPWLKAILAAWYLPIFALAIIGLFAPLWPTNVKVILLAPVFYFTAVHALYLGSVRYRVPLMPVVCIFAAAGALTLWNRLAPNHAFKRGSSLR